MPRAIFRTLASVFGLGVGLAGLPVRAEFSAEKLTRIDRFFQGEAVALAPDGKHLAYTTYENRTLSLAIMDLDRKVRRESTLVTDKPNALVPSRLIYLRWPTADRLILQTNEGDVFTVNADGGDGHKIWDHRDHGLIRMPPGYVWRGPPPPPVRIVPSPPDDPGHLYFETAHHGPSLYRADVRSGEVELMYKNFYGTYVTPQGRPIHEHSLYVQGRMLYDRQIQPRLKYWIRPLRAIEGDQRPFVYTKAGDDPYYLQDTIPPPLHPTTLDRFLGQKKDREFLITPKNYFEERAHPLAFDYDPNLVYYASSVGRDTYGIYRLDLATKARTEIVTSPTFDLAGFEPEHPSRVLVFDDAVQRLVGARINGLRPLTAWFDPAIAGIQQKLNLAFPKQSVELLEWTTDRRLFLARISSEEDPGYYALVDPATGAVDNAFSRAPWLGEKDVNAASPFAFDSPAGVHLTGYLTLPNAPKLSPPPLLIYCQGGLWDRATSGFNRDTQVLASMGVAVMSLNYRGSAGFGRQHLSSILEGVDSVPLEDITAAVEWISGKYRIDRKRVIIMGEGLGGYLALRGLQTRPDIFHSAISLNAPTNLKRWAAWRPDGSGGFEGEVRTAFFDRVRKMPDASALDASQHRPILVLEDDNSPDVTPWSTLLARTGLGMQGTAVERMAIKGNLRGGTTDLRAKIFQRIEEFLNEHLYNFEATIGTLKVLPDAPPAKK